MVATGTEVGAMGIKINKNKLVPEKTIIADFICFLYICVTFKIHKAVREEQHTHV